MNKTPKKIIFILITIIVAITLIRSFGLTIPILDDETNYVKWIQNPGPLITPNPFEIHPHPPLGGWLFFTFGKIFQETTWGFRLLPLLLGALNMLLLFCITRQALATKNQKVKQEQKINKTALLSTALLGLSYYGTLMALQIDIEGSALTTAYLLTALFYQKAINQKSDDKQVTKQTKNQHQKKYFIIAGFFFGVALLTKTNAVLFGAIIGIHLFIINIQNLIKTRKVRLPTPKEYIKTTLKTILQGLHILIPGILIFLSIAILNKEIFNKIFAYSSSVLTPNISILAIMMLILWATPLFLGLSLLQILKQEKEDLFFTIWLCVYAGIFIFLIAGRPGTHNISGGIADYSRYFMNLIIPLAYLSAKYIINLDWSKAKLKALGVTTSILLVAMYLLNSITTSLPTRDMQSYITAIKTLKTNIFFSFMTSSGNLLIANLSILISTVVISAICIMIILVSQVINKKNENRVKRNHQENYQNNKQLANKMFTVSLILFLSIGFAQNIFLSSEMLFEISGPNTNSQTIQFFEEITILQYDTPVITNEEGIAYLLNKNQKQEPIYLGKYLEGDIKKENLPKKADVILLEIPQIPNKNKELLLSTFKSCKLIKEFQDKQITFGSIYSCSQ